MEDKITDELLNKYFKITGEAIEMIKEKVELLDELECTHAIIMFDGDSPGRLSAKKVSDMFSKKSIKSSIIDLPQGVDPGVLTKSDVEFLLSKIM